VPGHEVLLDRADERGRLHAGQEVAEEALSRALEGRAGGGFRLRVQGARLARDIGGSHGGIDVVMDDREGTHIGVVDTNLLGL